MVTSFKYNMGHEGLGIVLIQNMEMEYMVLTKLEIEMGFLFPLMMRTFQP